MTIALTLWLAGMPLSLAVFIWATKDIPPDEDDGFFRDWAGIATVSLFIVFWPVFLVIWLRDVWRGLA